MTNKPALEDLVHVLSKQLTAVAGVFISANIEKNEKISSVMDLIISSFITSMYTIMMDVANSSDNKQELFEKVDYFYNHLLKFMHEKLGITYEKFNNEEH